MTFRNVIENSRKLLSGLCTGLSHKPRKPLAKIMIRIWKIAVDLTIILTLLFTAYLVWDAVDKRDEDAINYAWSLIRNQSRHKDNDVLSRAVDTRCLNGKDSNVEDMESRLEGRSEGKHDVPFSRQCDRKRPSLPKVATQESGVLEHCTSGDIIDRMLNTRCQTWEAVVGEKNKFFDYDNLSVVRNVHDIKSQPGERGNLGITSALEALYRHSVKIAEEEPNDGSNRNVFGWIRNKINQSIFTQRYVRLANLNLDGAYLHSVKLPGISMENAHLSDAELSGANLSSTFLARSNFSGSALVEADLRKAYLFNAELNGANLTQADLSDAHLEDAKLKGAILTNAKLCRAYLFHADLSGADLTQANLTNADLTKAILRPGELSNTVLEGATLEGAEITGPRILNDAILCHTTMPDGSKSSCEEDQAPNPCHPIAEAVGAPGSYSRWTSGAKQGIGTSITATSNIWYTIGNGSLNEVYYPRIDQPNVEDLQFIVSDGSSFVDLERNATDHQVQLLDPQALTYRQVNTKAGRYRITKTYVTDIERPTLLIETRFEVLSGGPYQLYVLYNPSLKGSGMGDTAATSANALVASDGSVASALIASSGFTAMSSGYSETASDGRVDLNHHRQLTVQFDSASTPGNIVQIGQISVGQDTTFTLALGFGSTRPEAVDNAQHALEAPFAQRRSEYEDGWHTYLAPLTIPQSVANSPSLRTQYNVALMALKTHEDKTFPGAIIASLSTPWGDAINADRCCVAEKGGYQAVWARDLYEVATAQQAAGDVDAANRALDYLLNKQQLPDGSFPHNTLVDGTLVPNINCGFNCQQLDEVAFPIILAHQLGRTDTDIWKKLKKAADFLVEKGPFTPQERWEEAKGFSPSTIAAEIAALVCAAEMAQTNGDEASAKRYRDTADNWQRNIEKWTFTTTGPHGNQYYIRIDDNQNPNDGHSLKIANRGGIFDEREIVDAGFLELVRLGVKAPNDPHVIESLAKVDTTIKVNTPNGPMFHRYNHDGYGEEANCSSYPVHKGGIGRLWPILTGERGEYELANGRSATTYLKAMALTANDGFMIAEQVSDTNDCGFTFGKGTNSATPLAWSMAQFVRLVLSIDAGKPIETSKVVADLYARETAPSTSQSP